jgi:nitrate/nitrite transporter NarK
VIWVFGFYAWFRDTPREHSGVNDAERKLIEEDKALAGSVRPPVEAMPLSWKTMLRSPTLWFLCAMYFCSNAGWCFFITWDVSYYKEVHRLEGTPLRIASGAPLFFGGIACLLGGFLTDRQVRIWGRRWGRTGQGALGYLLGGLFFLAAAQVSSGAVAAGLLCLASFTKDFALAASWSTCIDIGHRYSGTVSGFMNMIGNLGQMVTAPLVVWLGRRTGDPREIDWNVALYYSATAFFIAALCWVFINPRRVIVYKSSS